MRWQPFAVGAGFAAPPLVLALLVWPSSASAGADGDGGGDGDVAAELAPGDAADGTVAGAESVDYLVTGDGDGPVVIVVFGAGFDSTLTLVDADSGERLDFNDDTIDLDPQLVVELDDGESVVAQVRSLGGEPGSYTIAVDHEGELVEPDGPGGPGVPVPLPLPIPGPPTTIAFG